MQGLKARRGENVETSVVRVASGMSRTGSSMAQRSVGRSSPSHSEKERKASRRTGEVQGGEAGQGRGQEAVESSREGCQ